MIKFQVIGNVGKDASVNTVNGKSVINFTVAHTQKWKDQSGISHEKTRWIDCAIWRESTAIAQYIKKGDRVYVEGVPDVKLFDRNDGTKGVGQILTVTDIVLLGGKRDGNNTAENQQQNTMANNSITQDPGDLPF